MDTLSFLESLSFRISLTLKFCHSLTLLEAISFSESLSLSHSFSLPHFPKSFCLYLTALSLTSALSLKVTNSCFLKVSLTFLFIGFSFLFRTSLRASLSLFGVSPTLKRLAKKKLYLSKSLSLSLSFFAS